MQRVGISVMDKNLLTTEDIKNLSQNPSVEMKSITAKKVTSYYNGTQITERGLRLAEDIFRIMVEDVEVKVREILSESLKNCKNIPKDIAYKLIRDKNSVAIPFIKYYTNLTKEDLMAILEAQNIDKQKAVAQRKNLSEDISQYIAEKCPEEVVGVLISNDTAQIVEHTYHTIVNRYPNSENIKKRMVYRSELPISIIEKIVNSLSEELQRQLLISHNLPNNIVTDIVEQVKEKATLKISEEYSSDKQIEELVHQLYTSNRLTPNLVVRAICMGDLKFFEYSLVYLSNTSIIEVRKILSNTQLDFMVRNLLRKSFVPKSMFPAVFSALNVIKDIRFDCRNSDRSSFTHKVIERILTISSASDELNEEDVDYLISKIS